MKIKISKIKFIFYIYTLFSLSDIYAAQENQDFLTIQNEVESLLFDGQFEQSLLKIDEALKLNPESLALMNYKVQIYFFLGQLNEMKKVLDYWGKKINNNKFSPFYALMRISLAQYYISLKNESKAYNIYNEVFDIAKKTKNNKILASIYYHKSLFYFRKKEIQKAFDAINNSIKLRKEIQDSIGLGLSYTKKGMFYQKEEKFDLCFEYYEMAQYQLEKSNPKANYYLEILYNNMAYLFFLKKNYKRALVFLQKLEELLKRDIFKNNLKIANNYLDMGIIQILDLNYKQAIFYINNSLKIKDKIFQKNPQLLKKEIEFEKNLLEKIQNIPLK